MPKVSRNHGKRLGLSERATRRRRALLAWTILLATAGHPAWAFEPDIDYQRDIRPILSDKCFQCHGPDGKKRKAELRLDTREGLFEDRGGYAAVSAGQPDQSELIRRILTDDPEERMPPADSNKVLSPAQAQLVRRWVEQGAPWKGHWAFEPPVRPTLPAVRLVQWPRNPIDVFLLLAMERAGLSPSGSADRSILVRRVYLDLIGRVPSPAEADAFLDDSREDAYERLVDRLLASPQYGERWGRRWLDLARYADTNGYEKDRARNIWPFRDWVIDALNADLPFDQFTVAQLAGDMLPGATLDQRIATGFHRNTMLNEEGGIDPLEFRFHAMTDRVATTGTTWLGLTLGCCQCHDHKYDPVSQKEYYQLTAFLNNADEPERTLPDPLADHQTIERRRQADQLLATIDSHWPVATIDWKPAWLDEVRGSPASDALWLDDQSVRLSVPGPDKQRLEVQFQLPEGFVDQLRLEALPDDSLPAKGPGRADNGNFVLSEIQIQAAPAWAPHRLESFAVRSAKANVEQEGFPAASAVDGKLETGWAIQGAGSRTSGETTLELTLDRPLHFEGGAVVHMTLDQQHGGSHTLGRFRISAARPIADPAPIALHRRRRIERAFREWYEKEQARGVEWTPIHPTAAQADLPLLTIQDDGSVLASGDIGKKNIYQLRFPPAEGAISAIRVEALPDPRLPAGGPGMTYYEGAKGDFFLSEIAFTADGQPVPIASATQSCEQNRFRDRPVSATLAFDGNLQTGWSIERGQGQRHVAVFVFKEPVTIERELSVRMDFERYFASPLGRFRLSVTRHPAGAEATPFDDAFSAVFRTPFGEWSPEQEQRLREAFLMQAPPLAAVSRQIEELRSPAERHTTLVFQERPVNHPRPTRIHHRGEYLQPAEAVDPATPAVLHDFPSDAPRDRLGFARWLVARENPLVARVVVNRQWNIFFGRGIVRTVEDFGLQGDPPTHPELLDWLAVEFMESGWSLKRLHRTIVTSEAYRQSSQVTPIQLERDPDNRLLTRSPRYRLEAEVLRDSVLESAGVLSMKMGGPPVRPPQPEGITEVAFGRPKWNESEGEDRYRRSIYTLIKRTAPFAMFTTFDASSGEACLARREASNTPLQALTLLNDVAFVELAQIMGRSLESTAGDDADRIRQAFRRVLIREPTADEQSALASFVAQQRQRLAKDPARSATIAGTNDRAVERAVWTALARSLFSLDETITRN